MSWITCPWCNGETFIDEEYISEVECEHCYNIIPLDWDYIIDEEWGDVPIPYVDKYTIGGMDD